jgi:hypothetical protein
LYCALLAVADALGGTVIGIQIPIDNFADARRLGSFVLVPAICLRVLAEAALNVTPFEENFLNQAGWTGLELAVVIGGFPGPSVKISVWWLFSGSFQVLTTGL